MLQTAILATAFLVFATSLNYILKKFGVKRKYLAIFLLPLLFFVMGFWLRLSGLTHLIDLGYFFTESSYLYVYVLFSLFWMLGQLKYWKKQNT